MDPVQHSTLALIFILSLTAMPDSASGGTQLEEPCWTKHDSFGVPPEYTFHCPEDNVLVPGIGFTYITGSFYQFKIPKGIFNMMGKNRGSVYETDIKVDKYGCNESTTTDCLSRIFSCVEAMQVQRLCFSKMTPHQRILSIQNTTCGYLMSCKGGTTTTACGNETCSVRMKGPIIYTYLYNFYGNNYLKWHLSKTSDMNSYAGMPISMRKSDEKELQIFHKKTLHLSRLLIKYEVFETGRGPDLEDWNPAVCGIKKSNTEKIPQYRECPEGWTSQATTRGNVQAQHNVFTSTPKSPRDQPQGLIIAMSLFACIGMIFIIVGALFLKRRGFNLMRRKLTLTEPSATTTAKTTDSSCRPRKNVTLHAARPTTAPPPLPPSLPKPATDAAPVQLSKVQEKPDTQPAQKPEEVIYDDAASIHMPDLLQMNLRDNKNTWLETHTEEAAGLGLGVPNEEVDNGTLDSGPAEKQSPLDGLYAVIHKSPEKTLSKDDEPGYVKTDEESEDHRGRHYENIQEAVCYEHSESGRAEAVTSMFLVENEVYESVD